MTNVVERTVLVVIRTHTTLAWIVELLPDLFDDNRVQLLFTISDHRSVFTAGLDTALHALGLTVIPWEQALGVNFGLIIAASAADDLSELAGPLLILPHGPGYTKLSSLPSHNHGVDHVRAGSPVR